MKYTKRDIRVKDLLSFSLCVILVLASIAVMIYFLLLGIDLIFLLAGVFAIILMISAGCGTAKSIIRSHEQLLYLTEVCLTKDIVRREVADMARKTIGAFNRERQAHDIDNEVPAEYRSFVEEAKRRFWDLHTAVTSITEVKLPSTIKECAELDRHN